MLQANDGWLLSQKVIIIHIFVLSFLDVIILMMWYIMKCLKVPSMVLIFWHQIWGYHYNKKRISCTLKWLLPLSICMFGSKVIVHFVSQVDKNPECKTVQDMRNKFLCFHCFYPVILNITGWRISWNGICSKLKLLSYVDTF